MSMQRSQEFNRPSGMVTGRFDDTSTGRSDTCEDQQGSDESPSDSNVFGRLPVELIHAILEHASHEKATLSACALVSHTWCDLSRPHLFSSLAIASQGTFDEFGEFLNSHPDVARYVRRLELRHLPGSLIFGNSHANVAIDALDTLITELPELQVLHLRELWFKDTTRDSACTPNPSTPLRRRLKKLVLNYCASDKNCPLLLQTLHDIVQTFPADAVCLYNLFIADVQSTRPEHPDTSSAHSTRLCIHSITIDRIHTLRFPIHDVSILHAALRRLLAPQCLHTFRARSGIDRRNPESLRVFGEFINESGGVALRHLAIPFVIGQVIYPSDDQPDYWRALCLNKCPHLESFTFSIHVPLIRTRAVAIRAQDPPRVPVSAVLVAILSHLPSALRTLSLVLYNVGVPARIQNQETMALERLDAAIAERFRSLVKLHITLHGRKPAEVEECVHVFEEVMPECRRKGILDVVVKEEEKALGLE
ncbi:hypothetical protein C8Q73DRAFT_794062 [Cubamyces lactineus]|nr:hypothetical protein C8Q73DRAFT_794062 [Cubamyces lactineus]